jgi:translation initiation factor IF-2
MQSISPLIKKYKLTTKQFGVFYLQVGWKKYHDDINQISDTYYKKIESLIKKSDEVELTKKIKNQIIKKQPPEVNLKYAKVEWNTNLQDDFLVGMWFGETSTQNKDESTSKIWKAWNKNNTLTSQKKEETALNPFTNWFGNATVIRSEPRNINKKPFVSRSKDNEKQLWWYTKSFEKKETTKNTNQNYKSQLWEQKWNRWNIGFQKTNYKPKENEINKWNKNTSSQWYWSQDTSKESWIAKPVYTNHISNYQKKDISDTKQKPESKFMHKWIKIDYTKSGSTKITGNMWFINKWKIENNNVVPATIKKIKEAKSSDTLVKKTEVIISDHITVKEFSEKIGVTVAEIIKKLLANKIIWGINTSLDFDTVSLIANEFGVNCARQSNSIDVDDIIGGNIQKLLESDKDSIYAITRPPIVTVMGHVDHGKTKLLDYIRKTNIISWEAWGITQSIWASQIIHNNQKITFIDTPWHELFTSLRSRGAKITDVCIIVVAADDWIKPQTIEAIAHAKDSGAPIIIAITKIDKWIDNTDLIKSQMSEQNIVPEDRWWSTPIVKVSSVTGQGIEELLNQIVFQVEVLDLKYDPTKAWLWVILESQKDAKQWVVANAIIMSWSLNIGDVFVVHDMIGKVKRLVDSHGKNVTKVSWWDPVKVYGMSQIPEPGRILEVVVSEKIAQQRVSQIISSSPKESSVLSSLLTKIAHGDQVQLKLILKADWFWSLEALKYSMSTITMPENIQIKIVHSDVGNFSDSDLELAKASDSIMLWFNLDINTAIKKKVDQMKLTIKSFRIIYEILDYVEQLALGMVKHEAQEVYIGKLNVLWVFYRKGAEMIIGGRVIDGDIRNNSFFKIRRWEEEIGWWKVTSLQKGQESVDKIGTGYECGMKVKVDKKIEPGDQLEYFVME